MSKKQTTHGGARKGAGRKPVTDPKIAITIYIEESIVNEIGGIEEVKEEVYSILKKRKQK